MFSSIFKNRILPSEGARNLFIVILAITVFYIIAFRGILFNSDHVYQNWDNGIPPFSIQIKYLSDLSKTTWLSGADLGSPGVWTGINRYFDLIILEGLSFLGGKFLSKWLYLLYVLIGGTGFWLICRELGFRFYVALIVVLLSQFNPKTYSLIVSGHMLHQGFAYSLIPWFLFVLYKTINTQSLWLSGIGIIIAGIIGALIFSASPFGIILFAVFTAIFFIAFCFHKQRMRLFVSTAAILLIVITLHLYWLVPAREISRETGSGFKFYQTVEQLSEKYIHTYRDLSPSIHDTIIGHTDNIGMATEYVYPVVGNIGLIWKLSAYILLLTAVSGLFLKRQWQGWIIFSALCLFGGIILFSGYNTPFGRLFYEGILMKVKIIFFFMSRSARWLLVYYVGLALMAGFALHSWSDIILKRERRTQLIAGFFLITVLTIYWFPFWRGSLTMPKNDTTQTLSLMPQKVSEEEAEVVSRFSEDKEDYRITVLPTIMSPLGQIPMPPKSTYTRNYALLGKDAMVGPVFVGESFSNFLLNLLHREVPYTGNTGRLFGLGSVKYIVKVNGEKYYSYTDFGYMQHPNGSRETLFDPENVLEKMLSAQKDLAMEDDSAQKFKGVEIYKNADFLPRIRKAEAAYLASGGMPLFVSMSEMQANFFLKNAMFFGADLDEAAIGKLAPFWQGVVIHNNSWPELLLPFLSKDYWHPAGSFVDGAAKGWFPLQDAWQKALWFNGSELNNGALLSNEKAELIFRLKGAGAYRLFISYGREYDGGEIGFSLNENMLLFLEKDNLQRGFVWKDFGNINLDQPDNTFKIDAGGRGVAVRGILLVPSGIFNETMAKLKKTFLNNKNIAIVAEAEAVADTGVVKNNKAVIPLINDSRAKMSLINTKNTSYDSEFNRALSPDGKQIGEAIFEVLFDEDVSSCKLESYPRINNDKEGKNFTAAFFSNDGVNYQPIFRLESKRNGRWDDIYTWRKEDIFSCSGRKVFIKFELKDSELYSLTNLPNTPMRIIGEYKDHYNSVHSFGQAVRLPSSFTFYIPKGGVYRLMARIIGENGSVVDMAASGIKRTFKLKEKGAVWLDMGEINIKSAVPLKIMLSGSKNTYSDLFKIESKSISDSISEEKRLTYNRVNSARYEIDQQNDKPELLLFSEAFHPKWLLQTGGRLSEPIKAYGFMNAYTVSPFNIGKSALYFKYQSFLEHYWSVSKIIWILLGIGLFICCIGWIKEKRRKEYGQ